jgi:hypothetical protein
MFDAEIRPRAGLRAALHTFALGLAALGSAFFTTLLAGAEGLSGSALETRSGPRGATMFVSLPPAATGVRVENKFADPRMRAELYQEFEGGSIGTGVAIGD